MKHKILIAWLLYWAGDLVSKTIMRAEVPILRHCSWPYRLYNHVPICRLAG